MQKQGQVGRWAGGQIVVEELDTHCRPQATDRRPEDGAGLPNVSTPQPIDCKIDGTKRECLLKQTVEKLRSQEVEEL